MEALLNQHLRLQLNQLRDESLTEAGIIPWSSPVPVFGDIETSEVATVGLNPSNREFVDVQGRELDSNERRFHTLKSLAIGSWQDVTDAHVSMISDSCRYYFERNPYDAWFRSLDRVIGKAGVSFYSRERRACHLDLVPFATAEKWTNLLPAQRNTLLEASAPLLPRLLNGSPVRLLVLNGATVVRAIEAAMGLRLEMEEIPAWRLRRVSGNHVGGYSYTGRAKSLFGVRLKRPVTIIGYNHNIQSSFGVTREVRDSLSGWIAQQTSLVAG